MRRHVARLASLVVSMSLSLVAADLVWRMVWLKRFTIGSGIEDPHFHHRLKPRQTYHYDSPEFDVRIRTNAYGLRGPDPLLPKPPGRLRLLMLGDSYTFGFPVKDSETFCALVERRLNERGYAVDVINGGVSGYAPTLEYVSLRDQFLAFEPDLVILWYDLGDLQEDAWFQKNLLYDRAGRIVRCDPRYVHGRFDWGEWLKNHSALAKYFDVKVWRTIDKMRILGPVEYLKIALRGERAKVAIARLKGRQKAADLAANDQFLLVRESSTQELLTPYWSLSRRYLVMIRDLLAQRQIPLMLGLYPYGMLVGPDQWDRGRVAWGFERGRTYDATPALALFQRFSNEEQVPLVNTFERFRSAAKTEKLFYDWDGHCTPAGQRVIATHLVQDPQFLALLRQRLAQMRTGG